MYQSYLCNTCKKEFILVTDCIDSNHGYIACPYCGSRNIKHRGKYTDLNKCMEHSSYKVEGGVIKQVR